MDRAQIIIPDHYNYLFINEDDKIFAEHIIQYLILGLRPHLTPTLWQDVEIFIRYKKRDVWYISDEKYTNAYNAIKLYQIKYITEHLKKDELLDILNELFAQKLEQENRKTLAELLEKKMHVALDDLFFVQEKLIIKKEDLKHFDDIFAYPAWIEFSTEAEDAIFDEIYHDKLNDEQIDYFIGACDQMLDYGKWLKLLKHIFKTTHNSHTFWTAGDALSIIRRAVPLDAKSQKWFNDQIFEIFWPRVGNIWVLNNLEKIDFEADSEAKIMWDAIGWLKTLDDLKERLPELDDNFEISGFENGEAEFAHDKKHLECLLKANKAELDEILEVFYSLCEIVYSEASLQELKDIAEELILPLINKHSDIEVSKKTKMLKYALNFAKRTLKNHIRECENIRKLQAK